jgi:outer membrane protein assembly factor BamE
MNKLTLIAFLTPFLSACLSFPSLPEITESLITPYRDDIQQGSVLNRFKINQLKEGMSKAKVQRLIGSPSIIDPFHNNKWHYINHSTLYTADDTRYRLVLTFEDKKLTHIDTSGTDSLPQLSNKEKILTEQMDAIAKVLLETQITDKAAAETKAKTQKALLKDSEALEKLIEEAIEKNSLKKQALIKKERADLEKLMAEIHKNTRIKEQKLIKERVLLEKKIKLEKALVEKAKAELIAPKEALEKSTDMP